LSTTRTASYVPVSVTRVTKTVWHIGQRAWLPRTSAGRRSWRWHLGQVSVSAMMPSLEAVDFVAGRLPMIAPLKRIVKRRNSQDHWMTREGNVQGIGDQPNRSEGRFAVR